MLLVRLLRRSLSLFGLLKEALNVEHELNVQETHLHARAQLLDVFEFNVLATVENTVGDFLTRSLELLIISFDVSRVEDGRLLLHLLAEAGTLAMNVERMSKLFSIHLTVIILAEEEASQRRLRDLKDGDKEKELAKINFLAAIRIGQFQ